MGWIIKAGAGLLVMSGGYVWTVGQSGLNNTNQNLCDLVNSLAPYTFEGCKVQLWIVGLWALLCVAAAVYLGALAVRWLIGSLRPVPVATGAAQAGPIPSAAPLSANDETRNQRLLLRKEIQLLEQQSRAAEIAATNRPPNVSNDLIPLVTAIKRFGDAVPDTFSSYMVEANNRSLDKLMRLRAYRIWRLVPLQVKRRDSEQFKPLGFEERGTSLHFENGKASIQEAREEVSEDITIKESDLSAAIERAPTVPPGPDLVSLHEAVRALYDGARNNLVVAMTTTRKTEDEKLEWLAILLWGKVPLQVRFQISNIYEPLFKERQRGRRLVFRNGVALLLGADDPEQIESQNIALLRRDLDKAIAHFESDGRHPVS